MPMGEAIAPPPPPRLRYCVQPIVCALIKRRSDEKLRYRLLLVGFRYTDVVKRQCSFRRINVSKKGSVWSASFLL